MHGRGVLEMADGSIYMGYFKDDFPSGLGVIIYTNGDRYEGELRNGLRYGNGTYFHNDYSVYTG
jgi:hypothetical protein